MHGQTYKEESTLQYKKKKLHEHMPSVPWIQSYGLLTIK